jgi:hypothetical protein
MEFMVVIQMYVQQPSLRQVSAGAKTQDENQLVLSNSQLTAGLLHRRTTAC